jgi:hypothetical protein
MGVGGAPVSCLLEEGRPSLLKAVYNSLVESSIMAYSGDGGPPRVEPTKVLPESFLLGEKLRLLMQSAMNSRLPKQIVSLMEKPPHVKCSPSAETVSVDE